MGLIRIEGSPLDRLGRTRYSPLCSKCHGPGAVVYPGQDQDEYGPCDHCCGTGVEPVPWAELFAKGRCYR